MSRDWLLDFGGMEFGLNQIVSNLAHGGQILHLPAAAVLVKPAPDITVAVASLTRLTGRTWVKNPMQAFAGLTWTGPDVGGPCLETFGMISESSFPFGQGRLVT